MRIHLSLFNNNNISEIEILFGLKLKPFILQVFKEADVHSFALYVLIAIDELKELLNISG